VDQEVTARLHHASELAHHRDRTLDVLEHVLREDDVELTVAVRERAKIGHRRVGEVRVLHHRGRGPRSASSAGAV
jgi:hypothetical protein